MSVTWDEDECCPVCEAELATVLLKTERGKARVGAKCSRMLEVLGRLAGIDDIRRIELPAAMRAVK